MGSPLPGGPAAAEPSPCRRRRARRPPRQEASGRLDRHPRDPQPGNRRPISLEAGRKNYREIKDAVAAQGRDPHHCIIAPSAYVIAAESTMEAEDKAALVETLATDDDALSLLSEVMNFDFAAKGLDDPFTDEELANISGTQSMRDRVVQLSGLKNPTPRDFITFSRRAPPNKPFVGGPQEVADGLEEWFSSGVCDGFVVAATNVPGSYVDFVKYVVPELQRRGLYYQDYRGKRCGKTWACRFRGRATRRSRE